jgi:hypothetical protein
MAKHMSEYYSDGLNPEFKDMEEKKENSKTIKLRKFKDKFVREKESKLTNGGRK